VDTQVDFIDPRGRLPVPGAEKLIPNWKRLTDWAARQGILVVADVDVHHEDDPEFDVYPPHCLVGTPGQQKIPETVLPKQYVIPNHKAELPRDLEPYQQIVIEKQTVDVFDNPNLEDFLALLGKEREIVLYGVVTEICVHLATRGLLDWGFRVNLVRDAVRHWDVAKGQATLALVEERGGRLLTTDEVVSGQVLSSQQPVARGES
jgi:nicotinamidase/pyrazinamidase